MKLSSPDDLVFGFGQTNLSCGVWGETDRLTDVALCAPAFLEPVPCCSVTRESLRNGFETSIDKAIEQHEALRQMLASKGIRCHAIPPVPGMPDLCFTRDVAVATPWGIVALNPAKPHRAPEVAHSMAVAERWRVPMARIVEGRIEGGDICIARAGLLILGVSGERTDSAGAEAFASRFRNDGWEVLTCHFDPHFLHLDTIFCMIDPHRALACADVLDDDFLGEIAKRGIQILPVSYKEARKLGCNILSLDGRSVIASANTPRVSAMMRREGYEVHEIDITQLGACGGGIHCLTMPLKRERTSAAASLTAAWDPAPVPRAAL